MSTWPRWLIDLDGAHAIPPFVRGAARYIHEQPECWLKGSHPRPNPNQADMLATLPLVTASFWDAARREFEGFDWYACDPNDVQGGTPEFGKQWMAASALFKILK